MSYAITLERNGSRSKIKPVKIVDLPIGGTYMLAPSDSAMVTEYDLYFNITWNYSWYFYKTLGKDGIRFIYGKRAKDVIPTLEAALPKLDKMIEKERKTGVVLSQTWGKGNKYKENDTNYWSISAKNAKKALENLITFGKIAPYFTFFGD